WGAHHNDIAQWGLGKDGSGPVAVEAEGTPPSGQPGCYNIHPQFRVTYTYDTGTQLVCNSEENGVSFEGTAGSICVNPTDISARPPGLLTAPLPPNAIHLEVSTDHMGNFLDCVRSRKRPICDAAIGHRSVSVSHIGAIALRTGKRLRWDP